MSRLRTHGSNELFCFQISGREMFEFNPDMVQAEMDGEDDGGAAFDLSAFKKTDDDDELEEGQEVKHCFYKIFLLALYM